MTSPTKIYTKEEIAAHRKIVLAEIDRQFPYPTQRHNQKLVIYNMVKAYMEGKKYFILEASTGFGKSVAAVVALKVITALFSNEKDEKGKRIPLVSLICTKTKALQKQYAKDYTDFSSLWAASGYICNKDEYNSEAYYGSHECVKKICPYFNQCNYRVARETFIKSYEGILNYAYFMHFAKHKPDLLVLDEAHNLEKVLVDHLHVKFNPAHMKGVLEKLEPYDLCTSYQTRTISELITEIAETKDTDQNWFQSVIRNSTDLVEIISPMVEKLDDFRQEMDEGEIEVESDDRKVILYNGGVLESLYAKLTRLIGSRVEWVISERDNVASIDLKPVSLADEASAMFSRSSFVILMSATICGIPLFCKTLGIHENDYSFLSLDSEVPVENRQIVPVNLKGMSMANKAETLPHYVEVMDTLISKYGAKGRGLVHSVTYENAQYIKEHSKHRKRMIIPETEDMIEIKLLLDKHPNAILVTPAMTEGSDLSGDYCRFIFFFKIPFPYLGDKWVSRKKDLDNDWYIRETINQIVQGCGRGVRSKEDYAITFVLDGNFDRVRYKRNLMPSWFSNAIVGN